MPPEPTEDRCPECDGHGEIMLPEYEGNGYPCDACHGTGKARPASCPTCGSDDPAECRWMGKIHPHGQEDCCPDPWHGEAG